MPDDTTKLKESIQNFLTNEPMYDPDKEIAVRCDEGKMFFIQYGDDPQIGIIALGQTPEAAFNDFIDNWKTYCRTKSNHGRGTQAF